MSDEASRRPPPPTGTLGEILAQMRPEPPPPGIDQNLIRIERALARLEFALRATPKDHHR